MNWIAGNAFHFVNKLQTWWFLFEKVKWVYNKTDIIVRNRFNCLLFIPKISPDRFQGLLRVFGWFLLQSFNLLQAGTLCLAVSKNISHEC